MSERKKNRERKTSKYWKKKNNLLSDSLIYTGDVLSSPTHIQLSSYSSDKFLSKEYNSAEEAIKNLAEDNINWLHVTGLNDTKSINTLCNHFKINVLHTKDVLSSEHIAKIDIIDDQYILMILDAFHYDAKQALQREHVTLILGTNYIISFQETTFPIFENVQNALENDLVNIRKRSVDYLYCSLIANITNNYLRIIEDIQDNLEEIEAKLLELGSAKNMSLSSEIQDSRKNYRLLRRAIIPIYEDFIRLIRTDPTLIRPENHIFFLDIKDHLTQAYQTTNACRENLSTLMDLYFAGNDLRMNDIMKRLTVVSTLFIPLTFLVGVWGMNFKFMPELSMKYGYLYAWISMIVLSIIIGIYLRKRDWF